MPSIDPLSGSLLPELEDRFWTLLRDALERILGADGELANQYRLHLESASPYEKLLALHDDPIDVAAMLAGISLTEEHLARYDEMTRRSANTRAMEAYNYSMADDDFMPIEDATRFLRVPEDVLHSFIKGNKGAYEITEKKIAGVRRFKLAHLKRIQDQDPSFGGRKEVRNKLIVPISAVEEDVNIAKRASLFGSAALLVSYINNKYVEDLSVGISGAAVYDMIKDSVEKVNNENENEAKKIFRRHFGLNKYSFDLGQKYPYGGYHRDHFKAFEGIKGASTRAIQASESSFLIRPPNDDHLLIGGPVSTPTVQNVWQYENRRRVSKPILPLPFSFLIDDEDERTKGMEKFSWTFGDGTEKVPPSPNRLLNRFTQAKFFATTGAL